MSSPRGCSITLMRLNQPSDWLKQPHDCIAHFLPGQLLPGVPCGFEGIVFPRNEPIREMHCVNLTVSETESVGECHIAACCDDCGAVYFGFLSRLAGLSVDLQDRSNRFVRTSVPHLSLDRCGRRNRRTHRRI